VSLVMCCGAGYCLPLVGFVLSLIALINARRSLNPRRTRRMGVLGLLVSGVWVVIIAACIATYGLSISSAVTAFRGAAWHWPTAVSATETPTPLPTPAPTPLPDGFARVAGR